MTVVLVHGNPETDVVWDPLAARLAEAGVANQIRLSPPGFGAPLPADFEATPEGYRDWLIMELEGFAQPVDLVGHDWGGGHVINVAMMRPDLLRSWCSDAVGIFDPGYEWHTLGQLWQTPEAGEAWVAEQLAAEPAQRAVAMTDHGMDGAVAPRVAEGFDAAMGKAILRLYRARQPVMAKLGERLEAAAARPGLVILPQLDQAVGTDEQRVRSATRAGARTETLDGLGHWWLTEGERRAGAEALLRFWSAL